jgi:hypothetical protein
MLLYAVAWLPWVRRMKRDTIHDRSIASSWLHLPRAGGDFTLCLHHSDLARRAGGRVFAPVIPVISEGSK